VMSEAWAATPDEMNAAATAKTDTTRFTNDISTSLPSRGRASVV
jgi:hypothetical protein